MVMDLWWIKVSKQPRPHPKPLLELRYTEHSGTLEFVSAIIGKVVSFTWQTCMDVPPIAESDWVPYNRVGYHFCYAQIYKGSDPL